MKLVLAAALLALAFTTGFTCSKNTPPAEQTTTVVTPEAPAPTEAAPAAPADGTAAPAPTEAAPTETK